MQLEKNVHISTARAGAVIPADRDLTVNRILAGMGIVSLAIYTGFAVRFALRPNATRAFLDLGKMTGGAAPTAAVIFAAFALLFTAYWIGYRRLATIAPSTMTWAIVVGGAAAFSLQLLQMYPVGAADVYDNIVRGRMLALHGANPFLQVPANFPADPFLRFSAWTGSQSAYGPLWELLAAAQARVAGSNPATAVLIFKLTMVAAYAASGVLIWRILAHVAPDRALAGVYLFTWNPLVLWEIAGNGHNDGAMLLMVLLAVYFYVRRSHALAVAALMAGALVKFIPAALIPLALIGGLRREEPRRRMPFLLAGALLSGGLMLAAYAPFWGSTDPLNLAQRNHLFTSSLPSLVELALGTRLGNDAAGRVVNLGAAALLGVFVLYKSWRLPTDDLGLARGGLEVLLFYLLVPVPWLQPWYAIWPIGLAALLADTTLVGGTVLLSITLMCKYLLYNFVFGRFHPMPPRQTQEIWTVVVLLVLPWLYFIRALWARTRGVKIEESSDHSYV